MPSSLGRIATLLVLCVLAFDATAQTVPDWAAPSGGVATEAPSNSGGGVPPPPGGGDAPPQVPIDGGLSLLALAGGAYAVRRLRKKGKREDETEE